MQLWSEEIDAMRDEARQVVAAGMAAMAEMFQAAGTPPTDQQARVQLFRDLQARGYAAVPEAEVREIAGVPCRVFRPDGPATAIYLHFHGGGMMMGAPEMNDAGNLELSRRHGMAVVSVDYRLAPEHPFPPGRTTASRSRGGCWRGPAGPDPRPRRAHAQRPPRSSIRQIWREHAGISGPARCRRRRDVQEWWR